MYNNISSPHKDRRKIADFPIEQSVPELTVIYYKYDNAVKYKTHHILIIAWGHYTTGPAVLLKAIMPFEHGW